MTENPENTITKIWHAITGEQKKSGYEVCVRTRDCKGGSTDSSVFLAIIGKNGDRSPDLNLDNIFRNDFEQGKEDRFPFPHLEHIDEIEKIELWRGDSTDKDDEWFCEYISVRDTEYNEQNVTLSFPCHQWITPSRRYELFVNNYSLPQLDTLPTRKVQRKQDVAEKKILYQYEKKITGFPRRIASMPKCEMFSKDYQWDITSRKYKLFAEKIIQQWFISNKWETFEDMKEVYQRTFTIPKGWYNWKDDAKFGIQRLNGLNTTQLQRCEKLPQNLPVTDDMVGPLLEGHTLNEILQQKRLFMVDFKELDGVPTFDGVRHHAPIALFYANKQGELMPLAIQLFQEPADDNPIFLPSDPEYTWMLAKMYFNNADAAIHQPCNHLGFTHMVVESICCAVNQSLPNCHPVFQLLAPHFLYLIAIDTVGLDKLISPGGWFDTAMTIGAVGFNEILGRKWKHWRFDRDAWFPSEIKSRGVDDTEILAFYYSRDDSLLLHEAIVAYVTDVLTGVYDTREKLLEDHEVQEFASILVDEKDGAGMKGVFGGGKFEELDDLIKVVSATIFQASVSHAAANFCQYDEYAFPPNYPAKLTGEAPKDKNPRTLQDIMAQLPDKETTLSTMVITHLLSEKSTESLGYFDIQYQYEPKAVAAVKRFQDNLAKIGEKIDERNKDLEEWRQFGYLHPKEVPNAISI